jgi:hypothetical protein
LSVANNLGDIAKDHPDLAVQIGARWIEESDARVALVRHALRDLLKKGHRGALDLFGVGDTARAVVERLALSPKRIAIGGRATLAVTLRSTARLPQRLRLEYAITYARPNGRTGRKVFRISDLDLPGRASTQGNESNILPVWSPNGRRILFASNRGGDWDIYSQPADGSRPPEVLLKRASDQFPCPFAADGTLLFTEIGPKTGRDLWTLSRGGNVTPGS